MFFKRYPPVTSNRTSYVVADVQSRAAAVIDPESAVGRYVADAEAAGCRIRYLFFTNPDVAVAGGHLELRDRVGASIYVAPRCREQAGGTVVRDGDVFEVGNMRLAVICCTGSLPTDMALLVYDLADSDREPVALVAGETLLSRVPIPADNELTEDLNSYAGKFITNRGAAGLAAAPAG